MNPPARRLLIVALTTLPLIGAALAAPAGAAATCVTSHPSSHAFAVTVCLTAPADGDTLVGDGTVTATVSVSPSRTVKNVFFTLDGGYVLTDFDRPYSFSLSSTRWADGAHTLSVRARVRAATTFVTPATSIHLTFAGGGPVADPPGFIPSLGTMPQPGRPFVLAAVGDGADGSKRSQSVVDLLTSIDPNMVLYLGDVYERGSPTEFLNWYGSSNRWASFRSITNPTVGNHEYTYDPGAGGYFDYWNQPPHYYSFDVAGWHVVSLDANPAPAFGQTTRGSPQFEWLKDDLTASGAACTIVFYHQPRYSVSSDGGNAYLDPIWSLMADQGVDIVLNGHSHNYQRWAPLDATGSISAAGTTEIVAGTGGRALYDITGSDARVSTTLATARGAVRLTLDDGSASYEFLATPAPGTVKDSGTIACSPPV